MAADDIVIHDRTHVNLIYDVAPRRRRRFEDTVLSSRFSTKFRSNLSTPENLSDSGEANQRHDRRQRP